MILLAHWTSPEILRSLGLALLHFLWQGAALAAFAALLMAFFRSASARYVVAFALLIAMLAAPVVTFLVLQQAPAALPAAAAANVPISNHAALALANHSNAIPVSPRISWERSYIWLVQAWFLGVLLFSLRTAGGLIVLEHLRRKGSTALSAGLLAKCHELQRRIGLDRFVQYRESIQLDAPAVIGWLRPVVMLPVTALTGLSEAQLHAVIAHELAHIKRFDAFANLFQIAAESLLFYHPAVWWLSKRIRAERENCCDDAAIAVCGSPLEYARALTLMEEWRSAPALAMAANRGSLSARVRRLLGAPALGSAPRGMGFAVGVLCVAAALVAGNAFLGVTRSSAFAQATSAQSPSSPVKPEDAAFTVTAKREAEQAHSVEAVAKELAEAKAQATAQSTSAPQSRESAARESYIDSLKAAGYDNLTVDELISMKIQGITAEYIRGIQAEGFKPSVDELIGMKIQGVTADYIRGMKAAGLQPDADDLVGMKIQGVTPDYVKQMHELAMKIPGATPEDIKHLDILGMKIQGITPEYVEQMRAAGIKFDIDELIGMKIQGVTPEYARQFEALGLHPDAGELTGLKIQGVTPEYVKALQAAGLKFDTDELISAKIQGITPEFIEKARSHGFKNLDLEKLIQLKHAGVLE